MSLKKETLDRLKRFRAGARALRVTPVERRNAVLLEVARLLPLRQVEIRAANDADLNALPSSATPAFRDRLLLDESRLSLAAESLRQVAALADPLAEKLSSRRLANGLLLSQVRAPLGVIFLIFESRPNVALEAFSLALKSGNVILLRGGKESMQTTAAIYRILEEALAGAGVDRDFLWGLTDPDRALLQALLQERQWIDVVVPRGGDALIEFVVRHSRIPIIKNDRGLCHVYVDSEADLNMASEIVVNAKTQRPGVCNSMETLLVHRSVADTFLPMVYEKLSAFSVQWFVCVATSKLLAGKPGVFAAGPASFDTEYLDLKINCRIVESVDEALTHIEWHGSRHSEAIVTRSEKTARRFQEAVDAAATYWNASTRFTDGFEFGLGGELGISTQKLHVRGPVGLRELTSVRWVVDGTGQIRK